MTGSLIMPRFLKIAHEDNHCLVVDKPAGMLVEHDENHPAQRGLESALGLAKVMLKEIHGKPGNVFLQPVNRIDQPVSGVVVFAKTSKAASRLVEAFRERTVEKFYVAVVTGRMPAKSGRLENYIREGSLKGVMEIVKSSAGGAKKCDLDYQVIADLPAGRQAVLVRLGTGRKHQIRAQLAHAGCPIAGDRKYGSREAPEWSHGGKAIALHCYRLRFPHPTRAEKCDASSPPPEFWDKMDGFREGRESILRQLTAATEPGTWK